MWNHQPYKHQKMLSVYGLRVDVNPAILYKSDSHIINPLRCIMK